MLQRSALHEIKLLSRMFPCVVVLGPRQVGKTTLVQQYVAKLKNQVVYLDMELRSDKVKLNDIELFLKENRKHLVVIDEVQLMPEIFAALRPEIDAHRVPGRFILTGSASPDLVKGVSESLAGRVSYMEIFPFDLSEIAHKKQASELHWFRGGFPSALLTRSNQNYHIWAENFIRSYVERDLSKLFGVGITPSLARNFWHMIALQHGNIWNAEAMARSLGVSGPTVNRYLEFMEGAFLLRRLQAWFINAKKRMVKAPKVYVRDSGLLHHLNQVSAKNQLPAHPIVGASWEGYVIEEICRKLPAQVKPYFYRTHHGAEVDLILTKGVTPIAAIEIKYSLSPSLTEGFYNCVDDLKTRHNFVIYPGDDSFKKQKDTIVVGLHTFIKNHLPKICK